MRPPQVRGSHAAPNGANSKAWIKAGHLCASSALVFDLPTQRLARKPKRLVQSQRKSLQTFAETDFSNNLRGQRRTFNDKTISVSA